MTTTVSAAQANPGIARSANPEVATTTVLSTDRLWTTDEVATYLGVPKDTLYVWRNRGVGPRGRRVGKHLRYEPADVIAWFREQD
ncbi:helix-turn-helix domain-containing protein [Actinomadura oligospora]|uniref:helix-turn-helix domain-containing protein n=1 Tax=Actinomadura oligospora TaxID=111804 RepID=UPI0004B05711|nr:helix-turn-helix domain-containing protein [Actinomadura oligospora]